MSEPLIVIAGIAFLFLFFLIVRSLTRWRFCVLCAAAFSTWTVLLLLYHLGIFENLLLIAPLLGSSAVGIYYLVEKKVKEEWHLFRLPFYLTLMVAVYSLLGVTRGYSLPLFLLFIWAVFYAAYAYRRNPRIDQAVKQIIACCKDW